MQQTPISRTFYVRPSGAVSDKYLPTYVDGQLIITKTTQSISWGQDFSSATINQIIDLNASASSNLPVTYAVSDTSKAELAVTLQSNLDSWWKLDESSATTIADSSGSGASSHTAVLIGSDDPQIGLTLVPQLLDKENLEEH